MSRLSKRSGLEEGTQRGTDWPAMGPSCSAMLSALRKGLYSQHLAVADLAPGESLTVPYTRLR